MDFPYQQFFPERARTIQVDLRREQLGRRTRFDLGIVGDVKTTLEVRAAGFLDRGVDLVNPDFAKVAEASGILRVAVDGPEELRPALERVLHHDGPALLDVRVNTQELIMPPSLQIEQVGGFALYMARAVLNGFGDEPVDLARTNLLR